MFPVMIAYYRLFSDNWKKIWRGVLRVACCVLRAKVQGPQKNGRAVFWNSRYFKVFQGSFFCLGVFEVQNHKMTGRAYEGLLRFWLIVPGASPRAFIFRSFRPVVFSWTSSNVRRVESALLLSQKRVASRQHGI